MAIDERSRHDLFTRLREVLGEDHAAVLMEHLPPVGWADVATKRDLDHLKTELTLLLDAKLEATARSIESKMTHRMILVNTASLFTVAGLAFAAARLV
jgi:hypothetical protein